MKPQEEEEEEEERKDNSGSADCAEGVTDSCTYPQHCALSRHEYTRRIPVKTKQTKKIPQNDLEGCYVCICLWCVHTSITFTIAIESSDINQTDI